MTAHPDPRVDSARRELLRMARCDDFLRIYANEDDPQHYTTRVRWWDTVQIVFPDSSRIRWTPETVLTSL